MSPQRLCYILCGLLGLLILGGGLGYYWSSQRLSEGMVELSQNLASSQIADETLSQLAGLRHQYKLLEPSLPLINNALPAEKNQSKIALQLRNIAAASGMQLDNLDFPASTQPSAISQTTKAGDVLAMEVHFQLSGSYDQLQEFLRRQEHLDRYSSMTSLGISTGEKDQLIFAIALNVFVKP